MTNAVKGKPEIELVTMVQSLAKSDFILQMHFLPVPALAGANLRWEGGNENHDFGVVFGDRRNYRIQAQGEEKEMTESAAGNPCHLAMLAARRWPSRCRFQVQRWGASGRFTQLT